MSIDNRLVPDPRAPAPAADHAPALKLLAREPTMSMRRAADERQGTGHPHIDIFVAMWDAAPALTAPAPAADTPAPAGEETEAEAARRHPKPPASLAEEMFTYPLSVLREMKRETFLAGATWQRERKSAALTSSERAETLAALEPFEEADWRSAKDLGHKWHG